MWLQKSWLWIVGLVGGLALALALLFKKKAPIVLAKPEDVRKADAALIKALAAADETAKQKVIKIDEHHATLVSELDKKQLERIEVLEKDPQALNDFLKKAGQGMRDK